MHVVAVKQIEDFLLSENKEIEIEVENP